MTEASWQPENACFVLQYCGNYRLAAQKGADVTVVGRTNRDPGADRIHFAQADLSLMREAKRLGESDVLSPDLDVLLFTTGIFAATKRQVARMLSCIFAVDVV